MPDIFLSDVHLRRDRPDRGERLARLVGALDPREDCLSIVGDLCDFWFQSRQTGGDPRREPGLDAIRRFRDDGGAVTLLVGNHDLWLGPFYERHLGARVVEEPLDLESHGLRVRVEHGHRRGAVAFWKAWMEGRAFLRLFSALPEPVARMLEEGLDRTNERRRPTSEARHLERYRDYAKGLAGSVDLLVLGHVHQRTEYPAAAGAPRLIVLGDWLVGAPYLRIDEQGARALEAGPPARVESGERSGG